MLHEHYMIDEDLPRLLSQFTPNEKKDIVIIHSQINIFLFVIAKFVDKHFTLLTLLPNLPIIKPE